MSKQELIDKAVEQFKGVWPNEDEITLYQFYGEEFKAGVFASIAYQPEYVCHRAEFKKRARGLGWINGYKYGVEYPTNGDKPDLPDDVLVEQYSVAVDRWSAGTVSLWNWGARSIIKFRIVDERYKPKRVDVNSKPHKDDWFVRGELPPVGVECEYTSQFFGTIKHCNGTCKVIAYYQNKVWVDIVGYNEFVISLDVIKFRPIKTEREKFVEAACKVKIEIGFASLFDAMYDAGFRAPE